MHLLDANTVISFLKTGHKDALADLGTALNLCVVEEVKVEIDRRDPPGKRWWERSRIDVRAIALGSPAHRTLVALGLPSGNGLGERASIALAAHDPSLSFVTSDKNAMWIAVRELHGPALRYESFSGFLRYARAAALPWPVIDDAYRESGLPQPTWWASWRAVA